MNKRQKTIGIKIRVIFFKCFWIQTQLKTKFRNAVRDARPTIIKYYNFIVQGCKVSSVFRIVVSYSQLVVFNLIFIRSTLIGLFAWKMPIKFELSPSDLKYLVRVWLKIMYRKLRYAYWLMLSVPWTLNENVPSLKPLGELTNYPYSWIRTTDICSILYQNTNFFQLCSEQQKLVDVQLQTNLPYYLYLTNTENTVGLFPHQFLTDLEPYYYKLVLHCLQVEHARDPLVYIRFSVDNNFRQLLFTQITNEYLQLAKYKLNESNFIEYVTQKFSVDAELRNKLDTEIPNTNVFSTVELLLTRFIDYFTVYYHNGILLTLQDALRTPGLKYLMSLDPIFSSTIPMLVGGGILMAWAYFYHILLDFTDDKIHLVKDWWMRIRYFCLTTLNLDIQGEDKELLILFIFYGFTTYHFSQYMLTYKLTDLRRILRDEGLPVGRVSNRPVHVDSPVVFFIIRRDARNVYYRTGFNHALIRHPDLRSKKINIDNGLPSPLDLYPARNVSSLRFIEPLRLLESERFVEPERLPIFSGFNGYVPLLSHIGGRNFTGIGTMPSNLVNPVNPYRYKTKKEYFLEKLRAKRNKISVNADSFEAMDKNRHDSITQNAFMYKTYDEAMRYRAILEASTTENLAVQRVVEKVDQLRAQRNLRWTPFLRIFSLDYLLYSDSSFFPEYSNYIDSHGGEDAFNIALIDLRNCPKELFQQRAKCISYHYLKDLISRYPALFAADYNVSELQAKCEPFYQPLMTNVIADLRNKKQKHDWFDILALSVMDLVVVSDDVLNISTIRPTASPDEFVFTYEQFYKALKETPHLAILELLNSEWFNFKTYIDPSLEFEKLYAKYEYSLSEELKAHVELRQSGIDTADNTELFLDTLEDRLSEEISEEHQVIYPEDTFLVTQNLLSQIQIHFEKKELARHKPNNFQLLGRYSALFDEQLPETFQLSKKFPDLLSPNLLDIRYQYKQRLLYTPLTDLKHKYVIDERTNLLIEQYLEKYKEPTNTESSYENDYRKYDYDRQFAHDTNMDRVVFKHIKQHGITGEKVFLEALNSMIRTWGTRDPFIMRLQELYKTSKLDAFIELDPTITKELDAKLKRLNLSVSKLYNMKYPDFKALLERHRVPTWLLEASLLERVINDRSIAEQCERTASFSKNRRFLTGETKQPAIYTYTNDDLTAIKHNQLVSWTNQPAAITETSRPGEIAIALFNKTNTLIPESEQNVVNLTATQKKIACSPLRHLKFIEMYDPRDSEYYRKELEANLTSFAAETLIRFSPDWMSSRVFEFFKFTYKGTFLDQYDMRLHNLLQRLEKQFGLARNLAGHKTRTGRYLCSPKVVEYCELFTFFENIDKLLPKLFVGFSKNDDELDLTFQTFSTFVQPTNKIVQQYQLQLPQNDLYKDPRLAYSIYAPFTFEELILLCHEYETIFQMDYSSDLGEAVRRHVNRTFLNVIGDNKFLDLTLERTYYTIPNIMLINSIFPSRDFDVYTTAMDQKMEYAIALKTYNDIWANQFPLRRRPLRFFVTPFSRHRTKMGFYGDIARKVRLERRNRQFFKQGLYNDRIVRPNPFPTNSRRGRYKMLGMRAVMPEYTLQNNILLYPDRERRMYNRYQRDLRRDNRLFRRNMNMLQKELYAKYLLMRGQSQNQVMLTYQSEVLPFPECSYVDVFGVQYPYRPSAYRLMLRKDMYSTFNYPELLFFSLFNRRLKMFELGVFYDSEQSVTFLDYNDEGLPQSDNTRQVNKTVAPVTGLPALEVRDWTVIDYWPLLHKMRNKSSKLRAVEKQLCIPDTITKDTVVLTYRSKKITVTNFNQSVIVQLAIANLFKDLVLLPRVRILTNYLRVMPRRDLWLPELSRDFINHLQYTRDIVVLEDLFYILNTLNLVLENQTTRSVPFKDMLDIEVADFEKPKLFLLKRLDKKKITPQEILALAANLDLKFVEKVIRLRRVLRFEYNIKTELFDSIFITKYIKRGMITIMNKFSNLTQYDTHYLYMNASSSGSAVPIVPRIVFYTLEESLARSFIVHNLRRFARETIETKRAPRKLMQFNNYVFREYKWRYVNKYVLKQPTIIVRNIGTPWPWRHLDVVSTRPLNIGIYFNQSHARQYWFHQRKLKLPSKSPLHLENLFLREYASSPEFIQYKQEMMKAAIRTRNRETAKIIRLHKTTNTNSGYIINFLIPELKKESIEKTVETRDTRKNKPSHLTELQRRIENDVSLYLSQCKDAWNRTKPRLIVSMDDARLVEIRTQMQQLVIKRKFQRYKSADNVMQIFFVPDISQRIKTGLGRELDWQKRLQTKDRSAQLTLNRHPISKIHVSKTLPVHETARRDNLFSFLNLNHANTVSVHHLLDEVILTGFCNIPAPLLAEHFHRQLLFTGLELSTGKPTFGVWLNWSYGKPIKLWFPIYNSQTRQLANGSPGLIFLPKLTSYISEDVVIETSCTVTTLKNSDEVTVHVTKPFLEPKTSFSFMRWTASFREKELWVQFFLYQRFNLMPGDLFYDVVFTLCLYHLTAFELLLKLF
jgi:hypothetical protein